MILRVGDSFNVDGVGTKTVRSISFDNESADTGRSQMSGRTMLVTLTFTDRTQGVFALTLPCSADFDGDGDNGTDADIEAFFACLAGDCCPTCGSADFNADGDAGTDTDIEAFFRVLAGGAC
jgi:hypothetical protein